MSLPRESLAFMVPSGMPRLRAAEGMSFSEIEQNDGFAVFRREPQDGAFHGADSFLFFLPDLAHVGTDGLIQCRERLGGLLKYYYRAAA
jgi:hypothetical protein